MPRGLDGHGAFFVRGSALLGRVRAYTEIRQPIPYLPSVMPGFDVAQRERATRAIKDEARRLGFEACGVAKAERLDAEARKLELWLQEGRQASMAYMERHFEKRVDPTKLVDGAQTVISVLRSYYQPVSAPTDPSVGRVSRYAWGDDYHEVMKEDLYALYHWIDEEYGPITGRAFVDSAPVLDKVWAARSGLGWIGKHTNLISRTLGSYFFIGELIIDLPLHYDDPTSDYCGSCTRCIDACPTDAIYRPYAVDSNRCISYWTIEHRGDEMPEDLQEGFGNWIFGCDICQDVCPWNKFKAATHESRFMPREGMLDTSLETWAELDLAAYRKQFKKSPVKRARFSGLKRNVQVAVRNRVDG